MRDVRDGVPEALFQEVLPEYLSDERRQSLCDIITREIDTQAASRASYTISDRLQENTNHMEQSSPSRSE